MTSTYHTKVKVYVLYCKMLFLARMFQKIKQSMKNLILEKKKKENPILHAVNTHTCSISERTMVRGDITHS